MAKTDLEIANAAVLRPIVDVAADSGLAEDQLDLYGRHKAQVHLDVLKRDAKPGTPRYIIVTAMTPTKQGEGKTTVGLAQAIATLGHPCVAALPTLTRANIWPERWCRRWGIRASRAHGRSQSPSDG